MISITIGIHAIPTVINKCFVFALPIKNNKRQLAPSNKAVERFAGAINAQTSPTGMINGKKPCLKSLILFCLLLICLDTYMNKASFARSEVCIVMLIIGKRIQRLPSFILTPKNNV